MRIENRNFFAGIAARSALLCLSAAVLTGCAQQHRIEPCKDPQYVAERRARQRHENREAAIAMLARPNVVGPRKVAETLALIEREHEHDFVQFEQSLEDTAGWYTRDVQRFTERQPIYRRVFIDIMDGEPGDIPADCILLFY